MIYDSPRAVRFAVAALAGVAILAPSGCISEQSFKMQPGDVVHASTIGRPDGPVSTRAWLAETHRELAHLLPQGDAPALLDADFADTDGRTTDVYRHFSLDPNKLSMIFANWDGLIHSAQAFAGPYGGDAAAAWPQFEETWIPVTDEISLCGRLGIVRTDDGVPASADCIVIVPGLLADNAVKRNADLASALLQAGHHVLALEPRGHGQTDTRFPNVGDDFGVLSVGDLIVVSEWLEALPFVRHTGLVGYCWGGNQALLAAWFDGRGETDPSITDGLAPYLRPLSARRHFEAGILAFSPVIRFEDLIDKLERPWTVLSRPELATVQSIIRDRMTYKGHPEISGSLRKLIVFESAHCGVRYADLVVDGLRFLRFLPHRDLPASDKLGKARVPVLIVHGANDPLGSAQDVADLITGEANTNVAALILAGGGHNGFAAYARSYYFSLIVNYFDARHGAAACIEAGAARMARRPDDGAAPLVTRPGAASSVGADGRPRARVIVD
ncbi:Alpha/beta hydrolase family protein [Phycisphaerae bacterium RAS1]|nr:Alpha/beta hydrolase family protein [Phycisphaerae bacterium RAS1]